MTDSTLRDQIEALKAKKKLQEANEITPCIATDSAPAATPVAPHAAAARVTPPAAPTHTTIDSDLCERTDYAPQFKGSRREINTARTRCWGIVVGHVLCAPVASVAYSAKNGYWGATIAATGVAVIGVPLAIADGGFTLGLAAPVTSIVLSVKQVTGMRKRIGITTVAQADAMKFSQF